AEVGRAVRCGRAIVEREVDRRRISRRERQAGPIRERGSGRDLGLPERSLGAEESERVVLERVAGREGQERSGPGIEQGEDRAGEIGADSFRAGGCVYPWTEAAAGRGVRPGCLRLEAGGAGVSGVVP